MSMEQRVVPGPSSIVHELLNKENYNDWSVRVRTYLLGKDLWDVVETTSESPVRANGEAKFKSWRKSNAEALHTIQICCGDERFALIRDINSAKTAWETLAAKSKSSESADNPTGEIKELKEDEFLQYEDLYHAVKNNDWQTTDVFLRLRPDAIGKKITYLGKTALHTAVDAGHVDIVKKLVHMMKAEDLEIRGKDKKTALTVATNLGNMEMVKCMVQKNRKIVSMPDANERLPVVLAYRNSHWELAAYLYSITPLEDLRSGKGGATLISQCFSAKRYDIAWDLIQRCPKLAFAKDLFDESPIYALASVPSAFPCGKKLIFWKQWIYDSIRIPPLPTRAIADNPENGLGTTTSSVTIDVFEHAMNFGKDPSSERGLIRSVVGGLCSITKKLLGIRDIYEIKLSHVRCDQFLKFMCEEIRRLNNKEMHDGAVHAAIFRALEQGIPEFVISACKANRELARINNDVGRNIFQYAIEHRQEKVYSLIYGHDMKNAIAAQTDLSNNNMLHMAAFLSPPSQLNHIPSAAMKMQRELQWFKEVDTIVARKAREFRNWTDHMTPRDLFTKNHKNLMKDGEKWMKETATSFTVVGALIVTLMFATAFTVPGGYNQDTGYPIFVNERLFLVFIISDAASLFSATTSSLMFLGILTSRYAEDDFLKFLPTKMIVGLFTLFFSIATMMVAFCSALVLILHEKPWIAIPISLLSCVPVTLFVVIKIPLLAEMLVYTYGAGIFERNVKKWL